MHDQSHGPLGLFLNLSGLTQSFIAIIALMTVFFHVRFNAKAVASAPAILTTAGIFATFLGIAIGLTDLNLDDTHISESVHQLLGSLQTAFWASVAGVGAALTIKLRDYCFGHTTIEGDITHGDEVTAADLLSSLHAIQKGLVGSDEGTLLSQMKLSRQDSNDKLDQLKDAQLKALEKLSQMSSQTLVEALRDVIKDFNQKITEQFGENFKELNQAVGKLLEWQNQYKESLELTTSKLGITADLLSKATADYSQVVEHSTKFSDVATGLGHMMVFLEEEKKKLESVSAALANLLNSASGSMPEIEKKILGITEQLSSSFKENQSMLSGAITTNLKVISESISKGQEVVQASIKESSKHLSESIAANQLNLNKALADIAKGMTENQEDLNTSMKSNSDKMRESVADLNRGLLEANDQCGKQFTELADKARENVILLDKALTEELNKSLTSLGSQLTALSQQFVRDYTPLTERLRQLVDITPR
ncbi:MAG: hypothetical protein K8R57_05990 [Verrucomicrobia bacterium]|nr:hypothetical protein [Verrucomicrobiota bacterium]